MLTLPLNSISNEYTFFIVATSDFVDLPIEDIPCTFPKPRVVTVIDGSLDDDIDNLMNHDGTMTHSLIDAPKNFHPGDLKEINSNKEGKKHQRPYEEQALEDDGFTMNNYELVPAKERNNSSEKYTEDEVVYLKSELDADAESVKLVLAEKTKASEVSKSRVSTHVEANTIAHAKGDSLSSENLLDSQCSVNEKSANDQSPHKFIDESKSECSFKEQSRTIVAEDTYSIKSERDAIVHKTMFRNIPPNDIQEENQNETPCGAIPASEESRVDLTVIEDLTFMCIDAINKVALAEKSMGHREQHRQLLAIANVLKQRIPFVTRTMRTYDNDSASRKYDEESSHTRIAKRDINEQAKKLVHNLLSQIATVEKLNIATVAPKAVHEDSVPKSTCLKKSDSTKSICRSYSNNKSPSPVKIIQPYDVKSVSCSDSNNKLPSPLKNIKLHAPSPVKPPKGKTSLNGKTVESTQTSRTSLPENNNISAALKIAGDSMAAAVKMADALSLLLKSSDVSENRKALENINSQLDAVKEYVSKSSQERKQAINRRRASEKYMQNHIEEPRLHISGRYVKEEDGYSSPISRDGFSATDYRLSQAQLSCEKRPLQRYERSSKNSKEERNEEDIADLSNSRELRRRSRSCWDIGSSRVEWQTSSDNKSRLRRRSEHREQSPKEFDVRFEKENHSQRKHEDADQIDRHNMYKSRTSTTKHESIPIRNRRDKEASDAVLFRQENLQKARQYKSRRYDRKSSEQAGTNYANQTHHRDSEGREYCLFVPDKHLATNKHADRKRPHHHKNYQSQSYDEVLISNYPDKKRAQNESADIYIKSGSKITSGKCKKVNIESPVNMTSKVTNHISEDNRANVDEISEDVVDSKGGITVNIELDEALDREILQADSPTLDENTWSFPTRCNSPCDSYFDRVFRGIRRWKAPEAESKQDADKIESDYIRSKLVGSVVDPDTRDSDFDSIEFNGNARVSISKLVHLKYGPDLSQWEGKNSTPKAL